MEESLLAIVGHWTCSGDCLWNFVGSRGEMGRYVSFTNAMGVNELVSEVSKVFGVDVVETSVSLSFWYPEQRTVFTQSKMPPISIDTDIDLQQFKKKRAELGGLNIYVSFSKNQNRPQTSQELQLNLKGPDGAEGVIGGEEVMIDDEELIACVERVESVYRQNIMVSVPGNVELTDSIELEGNDIICLFENPETDLVNVNREATGHMSTGFIKSQNVDNVCADIVYNARMEDISPIPFPTANSVERHMPAGLDNMLVGSSYAPNTSVGLVHLEEVDTTNTIDGVDNVDGMDAVNSCHAANVSAPDVAGNNLNSDVDITPPYSPGDSEYDFDGWSELIDREYPPSWAPDKAVGLFSGKNSSSRGKTSYEGGESSGGGQSCMRLLEAEPIGFNLGIDVVNEDNSLSNAKGTPVLDIVAFQPCSSFIEDDFMPTRFEKFIVDDVFLDDAPPQPDNFRGLPPHERNMDLKIADDAIYVGRIYANKKDLHKFLSLYAMRRLFCFRVTKSDNRRVIANCVDKKCSWRIYGVIHEVSENVEIRTMQLKHSCDVASRSRYGEKATPKVLADLLQSKFANGKKGPRACELPDMVLAEHKVAISYTKAWHAKELAIANARGNEEESFKFLSTYLHLLKSTNPGTITDMVTVTDKQGKTQFKFLFLAFGASVSGFTFLRKVIVIDGTQMKGKYKGCLVAASGQDGNMQVFPLAFGIVDGENEASWVWFFQNLLKVASDEHDLVFVSDRHPAIYVAMRKVYPLAHHASCTVHLCRNVKARFKSDGLAAIVSKAARAFTVGDFRYWWAEIEKRSPKCAKYLLNIGLSHWTLSHFAGMRYNVMTSNISESLNARMTKAVDYPIVSMLESIRAMLMRWFSCRREKAKNTLTRCTPEIEKMLVEHLGESTDCAVLSASEWVYQVNDGLGFGFTVDLQRRTCTCRVFDVLKVPCCHALAARRVRQFDIYSFIGDCYTVAPWQKSYQQLVLPVPNANDVYVPNEVLDVVVNPPITKRGSGRPRKVRIPSRGELHSFKKKRAAKCGRCFGVGHNKKTCKVPI